MLLPVVRGDAQLVHHHLLTSYFFMLAIPGAGGGLKILGEAVEGHLVFAALMYVLEDEECVLVEHKASWTEVMESSSRQHSAGQRISEFASQHTTKIV